MKPEERDSHPDETTLAGYLETPKAEEFRSVRRHLITCIVCREELAHFQTMLRTLREAPMISVEKPPGEHLNEMALADYVEKRLSSELRSEIKEHLSACGYCTKAVLHYAVSTAEMEREGLPLEEISPSVRSKTENVEKGESLSEKVRRFFSWRMPVWIGVPATALAAAALFLMIYSGEKGMQIVTYQDRPEVVFRASKGNIPGIGFFDGARERSEPFEGIEVEPQDQTHLRLKWSEIETALLYEIKIYSSNESDRTLIGQANTAGETEVFLQVSALIPQKRYEWELSGKTKDGKHFLATGGFILGVQVRF